MRFTDQGVLVTGAASGIGETVAHGFAREGASLAVADRDAKGAERVAEAVRKAGGRAHAFEVDVTDPKGVAAFVEAAGRRLGRLDVLVNSAGVREIAPVLELSLEEWNRVMGVNITGTFLCSQAFARAVLGKGGKGASSTSRPRWAWSPPRTGPPTRLPSMRSWASPRRWRWNSATRASASMRWGRA